MSMTEALGKWSQACAAVEIKGRWMRNGNWVPLSHALRHADCEGATVTVVEQDGSTILHIEPKPVEPPKGKAPLVRSAFALIVTT